MKGRELSPPRSGRRAFVFIVAASWMLTAARAWAADCDPQLVRQQVTGHLGYRERTGDRCEGFYVRPQAGTLLALVSFGILDSETRFGTADTLILEIPAEPSSSSADTILSIQANSLDPRTSFRMDAQLPTNPADGSRRYRWPLQVLDEGAHHSVTLKEIGVLGKRRSAEGPYYLPVIGRLASSPSDSARGSVALVVQSPLRINTLEARFYRPGTSPGKLRNVVYGVPPYHPATIAVPGDVSGVVECDVRAKFVNGDSQPMHLRLRVP